MNAAISGRLTRHWPRLHPRNFNIGLYRRLGCKISDPAHAIFVRGLAPAMVLWIALKDWLTSNTVHYPYGESLCMTITLLVAGAGFLIVQRPGRWRDFVVVAGLVGCGLYWRYSNVSALAWGLLPGIGILLLSFSLPIPPDPRWEGRSQLSFGFCRRCLYGLAFVGGAISLIVSPGGAELDPQRLVIPVAMIAAGCAIRLCARLAPASNRSKGMLVTLYLICIAGYCSLALIGIGKVSDWSWIGSGLRSTYSNTDMAPALIGEDGMASFVFRALLLSIVLVCNLLWLLKTGARDDIMWHTERFRESLAASSSGVVAILAQVAASPACPANLLASSPAGDCNVAFSLAAIAIASRAMALPPPETDVSRSVNRAPIAIAACVVGSVLVIGSMFLAVQHVAAGVARRHSLEAPRWFIPVRMMPASVTRVVRDEGWPIPCAWQDAHNVLRRRFGSQAPSQPSMAGMLGFHLVAAWPIPYLAREMAGVFLGSVLSKELPAQRIEELYLNYRDYGAPSPGLEAASQFYFHRPFSSVSDSDIHFLVAYQSTMSEPLSHPAGYSIIAPPALMPEQYDFDEFPMFVPRSSYIHHDGAVNISGRAVGTVFAGKGAVAYSMYKDRGLELGDLNEQGDSFALAINDKNQSVGYSMGSDGNQHAAAWNQYGEVRDLGAVPGYSQGVARCINNRGHIAGFGFNLMKNSQLGSMRNTLEAPSRAFLRQSGRMTVLGVPAGYIGSRAYAINERDQIAGWVLTGDDQTHAMVWENGRMQDIGTLGGDVSVATGINNRGQVVGSAARKDGTIAAFLWQEGVMRDLGMLPGDDRARAWAINDSGVVVGYSFGKKVNLNGPGGRPFIWDSVHGMRDLTSLYEVNSELMSALDHANTVFSINNAGEILGLDFTPHRPRLMFLLKPRTNTPGNAETIEADWGRIAKASVQYDTGASFSRVVGQMQRPGASITYSGLDGGQGGPCALTIRYSVPFDSSTTLYVNGAKRIISFPKTAGWRGMHAYKTVTAPVSLRKGRTNTIIIRTEAGNKAVNLDNLRLSPASETVAGAGQ